MRVLVVEDEVELAKAVERGLRAEGMEVDVVHDGLDGLWRLQEGSYDVVVLDIMLPGLNGYRVTERLREAEIWTPVLMLTAKDGEYDEADGLEVGADDYLRKPFSFVVLVARVRALARRGHHPRPRLLGSGSLALDPAEGRCWNGDREVALTPRERALLEVLLRNQGRVVDKETLLQRVWGMDHSGDPNVVEVYVLYLRRKIGADRIQTVRGLGYRLVDPDA